MPIKVAIPELQVFSDHSTNQLHVFERGAVPHEQVARHPEAIRIEQAVKGRANRGQNSANLDTEKAKLVLEMRTAPHDQVARHLKAIRYKHAVKDRPVQ